MANKYIHTNIRTLLANGVGTVFINGKPALVNDAKILSNPPWLLVFLLFPFKKKTYIL